MANRETEKVEFAAERVRQYMKEHGISMRRLAKELDRDERTVRGYFKEGKIPRSVLKNITSSIIAINNELEFENPTLKRLEELHGMYIMARNAYLNYKRRLEKEEIQ